jgi:hypothetical protein
LYHYDGLSEDAIPNALVLPRNVNFGNRIDEKISATSTIRLRRHDDQLQYSLANRLRPRRVLCDDSGHRHAITPPLAVYRLFQLYFLGTEADPSILRHRCESLPFLLEVVQELPGGDTAERKAVRPG